MNHLVLLDPHSGELEKILSGTKSMVLNEFSPCQAGDQIVSAGDWLYFLKDDDEHVLQVKATVVRVLFFIKSQDEELCHLLKEMQPRLQLTEDQYNTWSGKQQVALVEFSKAQKINPVCVAADEINFRSGWIAFKEFSWITKDTLR